MNRATRRKLGREAQRRRKGCGPPGSKVGVRCRVCQRMGHAPASDMANGGHFPACRSCLGMVKLLVRQEWDVPTVFDALQDRLREMGVPAPERDDDLRELVGMVRAGEY